MINTDFNHFDPVESGVQDSLISLKKRVYPLFFVRFFFNFLFPILSKTNGHSQVLFKPIHLGLKHYLYALNYYYEL